MNAVIVDRLRPVFQRTLSVGYEPSGRTHGTLLSPEAIRRMSIMWRAGVSVLGIATCFNIDETDVNRIALSAGWQGASAPEAPAS